MSIERKTIPYEILIRFNGGASHQVGKLGDFCGAHFIEAEIVVDTDTAKVLSYNPGAAKVLPEDMIAKYFTEQFGKVNAGFEAMQAERDEAKMELQRVIAAAKEQMQASAAHVSELKAQLAAAQRATAA